MDELNTTKSNNKLLLYLSTVLGFILLIVSVVLMYFNPVLAIVHHRLRLENGSLIHSLLLGKFTSTKIQLYIYNVTNADRFLDGTDEKVHLQEIGPYVYQEYRSNLDVEINKDPRIMRFTPKVETVFIPEESIGDPKDVNVTVPNIVMLSATAMISKYSFLVRQIYNMVAARSKSKPFVTISAYDNIWGYSEPLIKLANNAVPGLMYFDSVSLLERLYDVGVQYRLEMSTRNSDKFSVKKSTRIQPKNTIKSTPKVLIDSVYTYNNSYEGAAFPPNLSPERPIFIYRHGVCKTFQLDYKETRKMPYGGDAFVYQFHNNTFSDREQCDTKGWCPDGLMNLANCYFGFPVVLSKGHFLDSDPRLLEKVEGLKPNRTIHDTEIVIDPIIGIGITGTLSLQLNMALADVGFNSYSRRLKDTVLPVSNIIVTAPPMIEEVSDALDLMYKKRPIIMLSSQIISTLLGILLLSFPITSLYRINCQYRLDRSRKHSKKAQVPLLVK